MENKDYLDALTNLTNKIQKVAINKYRAVDWKPEEQHKENNDTLELAVKKVPMEYRREDLSAWAKEAFDKGEDFFFAEPDNPLDPYGRLHLTEPKYKYVIRGDLSEKDVNALYDLKNKFNEEESEE